MDLDDFKDKWAGHDRTLEASVRLNRRLLSAASVSRARSGMQRLAAFVAFEMVIQLAAVGMLGEYAYVHRASLRFALPAAALDVLAIAFLVSLARQMAAALRIDHGRPIAALQKQLGELRVLRLRHIRWTLLAAPLAWTPLLIVVLEGVFGVDAYRVPGTAWLWANLLFGLAFIPVVVWVSKRFGQRMGRSLAVQRLVKDLAGHEVNAAAGFLAEISEFEREEG
jgi:hypothetical protein